MSQDFMDNGVFGELMGYSATAVSEERKRMRPSERLLLDIHEHGFDMSQLKNVLTTKGNQLIVSCAGSGKTTALIFKVIYDLKSGFATRVIEVNGNTLRVPEKIWVATFLKSGAVELGNSFRSWEYKLHVADVSQSIQFSTLHAEFKRALNQLGLATDIIDDKANTGLLKKVVKKYALKNANGYPMTSEDIGNLASALTYTRNRLDRKRYVNQFYTDCNLVDTLIDNILFDWKAARMELKKVDFEDLQERLYFEIYEKNNQEVIDFIQNRFSCIYVDEFQDTSQIQYALLKVYSEKAKQVVAIGDDDQTIYSWRGSDHTIITERFMEDFNPVKSDLSVNFRCPSNVLNAIAPSIKKNKARFDKDLKSFREGGKVRYGGFPGYRQMALSLGDMVYEDVKNGKSVAILCRVNSDGLTPALFFDKLDKFSFSVSGQGMTLDSYVGRLALSIVKLFTEKTTTSVKNALKLLTWDKYCVDQLIDVCKNNKLSIWTVDEEDIRYSCPSIADILLSWRSWREMNGDVQTLRLVLNEYKYSVFNKDNQFNDVVCSVLTSLESLLDCYDYSSVEDFLMDLEDIDSRLKAREKKINVSVSIATVHEFKGKEADCVYVWNDSADVFPYKRSLDSEEAFEEERRIHYIANTRARETSTVLYLKNRKGMFVDEMDLQNAEEIVGETSGVIKKAISGKMKEEADLRKFEKETSVDTGDLDDLDGFEIV